MPSAPMDSTPEVENFIARWEKAEASERANYQMFLTELADLLGVPHPDPAGADNEFNAYVFDRAITRQKADGTSTTVWADLYKRGCFTLDTASQTAHPESKDLPGKDSQDFKTVRKTAPAVFQPETGNPKKAPAPGIFIPAVLRHFQTGRDSL